jgi:hypothetical protein
MQNNLDKIDITDIQDLLPAEISVPDEDQPLTPTVQLDIVHIDAGKAVCRDFITSIVKLKLPASIKKSTEIKQLVQMHKAFEEFTLEAMFTVVSKSIVLLNDMSAADCYDVNGVFDPFRLQAIITTQQHVMHTIATFNAHVRRLPVVFHDLMHDLEVSQTIDITSSQGQAEMSSQNGFTSAKPMARMLKEAVAMYEAEAVINEQNDMHNNDTEPIAEEPKVAFDDDEPIAEI